MDAGSLAALESAIARDLDVLEYPAKPWMPKIAGPAGEKVYDVVVVGAGHCGVAAAFALIRERIGNILVIDENPAGEEGPWMTYARMPTLRTRKNVTGLDLGIPNLTFGAYFVAKKGQEAWDKLSRIYCPDWRDYLLWLREILSLPVENGVTMTGFAPEGKLLRLDVRREGRDAKIYARRIVLANGPLSMGGFNIPDGVRESLPKSAYAHVCERVDFRPLVGKRLAVVGGGASAFDNAGMALEQGVASVDQLIRRPSIPRVSVIRATDWAGFLRNYADLDDAERWQLMREIAGRTHNPPPLRALERVEKWPNFSIHFDAPITAAHMEGTEIVLETPQGIFRVDYLLLGTGFTVNLPNTPTLAPHLDKIALWADRYVDPQGPDRFKNAPYLGRHFEFIEKVPGTAPWLSNVFVFNQAASLSMGPTGRVSGLKYGLPKLMSGICLGFLREDFATHLDRVAAFDESEIEGHRWASTGVQ
ncbi:MAG TPA: NAD(P)/FAD-dependent oxidoreductase, partial [Beijerinckiaceae bacterium]|nr:NAD(P)/FAD-dependent oxidoreductase [Beijerinckiaceae bacterium]